MEDITKTKRKFITSPLGRLGGVLILLACLFAACGSDDDEPEYFNPVEGVWERDFGGGETLVRVYTRDFTSYEELWKNKKLIETYQHGKYKVKGSELVYSEYTDVYRFESNNIMYLNTKGSTKNELKYIRKQ